MIIRVKGRGFDRAQKGFTLLELMVAMAIFAILAVAGWQVFDSISRSKARAQMQADVLTDLQYAYQQMQRDMTQVVAYQLVNTPLGTTMADNVIGMTEDSQASAINGFTLQDNRLSFIRFADPDPRYVQSAILERVVYSFSDGNLVRERYRNLNSGIDNMDSHLNRGSNLSSEQPLKSIILQGVSAGKFQVLLPQPASQYPHTDKMSGNPQVVNPKTNDANNETQREAKIERSPTLPKGVSVSFSTTIGNVDAPIHWVYALSNAPPSTDPIKSNNQ